MGRYEKSFRGNFYPRSPCGERRLWVYLVGFAFLFLSTLSLRRATSLLCFMIHLLSYFYPRSPCGERHSSVNTADQEARFLSTLSLRRATGRINDISRLMKISIHALLAESDPGLVRHGVGIAISIHALLAESDLQYFGLVDLIHVFLSTLSLRRVTVLALCSCGGVFDFYPRSPCGERRQITQT